MLKKRPIPQPREIIVMTIFLLMFVQPKIMYLGYSCKPLRLRIRIVILSLSFIFGAPHCTVDLKTRWQSESPHTLLCYSQVHVDKIWIGCAVYSIIVEITFTSIYITANCTWRKLFTVEYKALTSSYFAST